jgi:hypothetical protein
MNKGFDGGHVKSSAHVSFHRKTTKISGQAASSVSIRVSQRLHRRPMDSEHLNKAKGMVSSQAVSRQDVLRQRIGQFHFSLASNRMEPVFVPVHSVRRAMTTFHVFDPSAHSNMHN